MDADIYNSFLINSSLKINENEYILIIRSKLGVKLVEQYRDIILNEIKNIIGHLVVLTIQTETSYKKNDIIKPVTSEKIGGLTFQNFIIGPSNKQAFLASQSIYKDPGSKFNPLFIYGDSEVRVIYLESNDFVKQIINVLTGDFKEIEKFKNDICKNDILIIDDIQFLANKDKTNEFFFSIFNTFIDNNKQIVFSSDKSPDLLNGFDKRMITRFNSGLVAPIKKLDFETSHIIFEYELSQNNIKNKIDEESINYLINYFTDDVRKIKGIINQLRFYIDTETVDDLNIKTITELFKDSPSSNLSGLNVKKIKENCWKSIRN
ncbi:hypothetical protein FQA39_LY13027 [Lamprigera yunnana]|nr:hypothetical protein FQA39_LY13027 [Lamprigera yunnana]